MVAAFLAGKQTVMSLTVHPHKPWLYSGDSDGQVMRWNTDAVPLQSRVYSNIGDFHHAGGVWTQRPLPAIDGFLIGSHHLGPTLWRTEDNYQQAALFPIPPEWVLWDADVSHDVKRIAFVASDISRGKRELRVFDLETGQRVPLPPDDRMHGWPSAVRFSPDGRLVASGNAYGYVLLRDVRTLEVLSWGALREHRGAIGKMAFSADSQILATTSNDGQVKIWRMPADFQGQREPLKSNRTLQLRNGIQSMSISPDGGIVFVGFDETEVWDVGTGEKLFVVPGQEVACSPDGTLFVTGGGKLRSESVIWDTKTGKEQVRLHGAHRSHIMSVAFSAEGRHVLTGDYGGNLKCWDAGTGYEVLDYRVVHASQ
jgi:WD40 repeat protein